MKTGKNVKSIMKEFQLIYESELISILDNKKEQIFQSLNNTIKSPK
jgi:hypothetical protein